MSENDPKNFFSTTRTEFLGMRMSENPIFPPEPEEENPPKMKAEVENSAQAKVTPTDEDRGGR